MNAAGIIRRGDEHRPEVFAEVLAINLTGAMRAAEAAHDPLAAAKGCIVNVASMLSFFGGPLVPGVQREQGRHRPADPVARGRLGDQGHPRQRRRARLDLHRSDRRAAGGSRSLRSHPRPDADGPLGDPAEVAGAIAFLTGPDAGFVTGAVLPVDGGYLSA